MSEEQRASADLRREVEEMERRVLSKQHQIKAVFDALKTADGQPDRAMEPQEHQVWQRLEGEAQELTAKTNALKMDYFKVRNAEEIERRASEPMNHAAIFSGEGGQGTEARTDGGAIKTYRVPDNLGEAFVNSSGYKSWVHGSGQQRAHIDVDGAASFRDFAFKAATKATLTSSGFTSYERVPGVVELGQQPLTVADLCSQAQTTHTTVRYLQETSFTNTAAMVAEEGQKPEATWVLAEVDTPVRKIAWMTRVTTETWEDYPAARDYINNKLPFGVRQREEFQILAGDGTGQNLTGITATSGILTQAKGSYNNIDALYLGITKVRTQGFFEPDAIVIDPTNWSPIRLLKTTIGSYIYGDPSAAGPETIFGKRVVVTVNMTDNTALVGAFKMCATIWYRWGLRVEATNSDASDFQYNRIALRGEQREALEVSRPKGFCTVTGLDSA